MLILAQPLKVRQNGQMHRLLTISSPSALSQEFLGPDS